jgi:hypothetical protein
MKKRSKTKKSNKIPTKKSYQFGGIRRINETDVLNVLGATGLSFEHLGPLIAAIPT